MKEKRYLNCYRIIDTQEGICRCCGNGTLTSDNSNCYLSSDDLSGLVGIVVIFLLLVASSWSSPMEPIQYYGIIIGSIAAVITILHYLGVLTWIRGWVNKQRELHKVIRTSLSEKRARELAIDAAKDAFEEPMTDPIISSMKKASNRW